MSSPPCSGASIEQPWEAYHLKQIKINLSLFLFSTLMVFFSCQSRLNRDFSDRSIDPDQIISATDSLPPTPQKELQDPGLVNIPMHHNSKVDFWLNYYTKRNPKTMQKWLDRRQQYAPMITKILKEQGLSDDFISIAKIESGLSMHAKSSASAVGPWQFMKRTALHHNLNVSYWIDERKDLAKSTHAAATYLKQLHKRFGDWHLAMAAYNAGQGTINKGLRRSKTNNYWDLAKTKHIRNETKNYIPKFMAAQMISKDPEKYGFTMKALSTKPSFPDEFYELKHPYLISEIASYLKVSPKQIKKWNPEILRDVTPPVRFKQTYKLRLPTHLVEKMPTFIKTASRIEIDDVKMVRVKSGDTLSSYAKKYGVSIKAIKQHNPKLNSRRMRIGKNVAIPLPNYQQM